MLLTCPFPSEGHAAQAQRGDPNASGGREESTIAEGSLGKGSLLHR
jgi:hypothetical protein